MDKVSIDELHERIVRDTFPKGLGEPACLLLFSILHHYYQIELSGPVLSDTPCEAGELVCAITQRHAGAAVAVLWPDPDDRRSSYVYWYHRWNEWGSYPRVENLTADERARMRDLIRRIEQHPFVSRLVPEDFDPAADPA